MQGQMLVKKKKQTTTRNKQKTIRSDDIDKENLARDWVYWQDFYSLARCKRLYLGYFGRIFVQWEKVEMFLLTVYG